MTERAIVLLKLDQMTDTEITLPTSYRNTFVTTIASKAFNKAMTLTNVVIPNTYKKIEKSAFFLCDNIASITVPFIGESTGSSNSSILSISLTCGNIDGFETSIISPLVL